ncbi:unnamed protein product [Lathyrus oleraceus]
MMENKRTFDLVSDDSDHRFRHYNIHKNCFTDSNSFAYRRIMNEWKVLAKDLPDSIHVRVYEHHVDILRAVIVGSPGTPYQDGLFFFDIALPKIYPFRPPKIHYISFGYRLNPNLYPAGTVCLGIPKTWKVNTFKSWSPARTLLKARAYNASVFVLTCYSSVCLIRKPPKNLEEFVEQHFRDRGHVLLAACEHYGYNSSNNSMAVVEVTESFQASLQIVYRNMYKKFLECGASLEGFVEELKVERQVKGKRSNGVKGILKKATGKIQRALGW